MYFLILLPLLAAAWFLLSRYVFEQKMNHQPLFYFGIVFAGSLIATEFILENPFSWLQFTPVTPKKVELAGYWQHGISVAMAIVYLVHKRSLKPKDIAIALTLWVVGNTVFVTLIGVNARIDYPFDLEWMEGTMVDHTIAVKQDGRIYGEPTANFVPFLYGPVFTRMLAVFPYMEQSPYIWGRLLSLLMVGLIALLIYFVTTTLSKDSWIGLLVALTLIASNRFTDYWFDIYRVDSTFVFLLVFGGVLLWQRPQSNLAVLGAGISLALAVFSKQSAALMVLFFVLWFLWTHGWRRALWLAVFGAATGVVLMAVELLHSGAHFVEYFFDMLFIRSITWKLVRGQFINKDLLGLPLLLTMFLSVTALIAHYRRVGAKAWSKNIWLYVIIFFTITSFAMRSKGGGWFNCRIPMIVAGLIGVGHWFGEQRHKIGPAGIYPGLILILVYLSFMDPLNEHTFQEIPKQRDLAAHRQMVEYIQSRPGVVWVPAHTHLCYQAKKQLCWNIIAAADWLKLHGQGPPDIVRSLQENEVKTMLFDRVPLWFNGPLRREMMKDYRCKDNKFRWPKRVGTNVNGMAKRPKTFCELKEPTPKKDKNVHPPKAPPIVKP